MPRNSMFRGMLAGLAFVLVKSLISVTRAAAQITPFSDALTGPSSPNLNIATARSSRQTRQSPSTCGAWPASSTATLT
jgi:hypothetical protein